LSRLAPRLALIGTCAVGASGFLAGPAAAATLNNYVTQPVVTGVSSLTPESAVISGKVDTGGNPAAQINASAASPYTVNGLSGLTLTSPAILDGIPVGQGYYSTALFEADPLSDYVASGNQPGGETVTAQAVEVPTTTGQSVVSAKIGAFPAANAFGSTLKPGTKYVYWVVQQAGETDQATTVNEYSASDLANWLAGSGTITANGFATSSNVTSTSDYAAWAAGTGSYAGDPMDPTKIPASIVNPDYACVVNTKVAANTNATWAAELAATKVPLAAGSSTINGTAAPYGVAAAPSSAGAFKATSGQQPAEQGPCVAFFGGNSANFYTSAVGTFKTPPLGKIVVGRHGLVAGKRALLKITDRSVERAAGTISLWVGRAHKTVASGRFSVRPGRTGVASLKLTPAGLALLATSTHLMVRISVTSTTDQPSPSRTVILG